MTIDKIEIFRLFLYFRDKSFLIWCHQLFQINLFKPGLH